MVRKEMNAYRDWRWLLVVFFVLLIVVVGINVYIFMKINRGEIFQSDKTATAQAETIDRDRLKQTIDYYTARAEHFEAL